MTSYIEVTCAAAPALLLPSQYRKKNLSKQMPKELYLRNDLPCHTMICGRAACAAIGSAASASLGGGAAPSAGVLEPSADHYVVPSLMALQRFISLFARAPQIHLLLLRTHASQAGAALTRQMRELLAAGASRRRAVLFENEAHAETATVQSRADRESNPQRQDRAVRRAARWFARHTNGSRRIILLEAEEPPTEESVRQEQRMKQSGFVDSDAPKYPREIGGITVHSMDSYLRWLSGKDFSAKTSTASSEDPSPSELLTLYESMLASEKSKVAQKISRAEAGEDLAVKLARCKLELKRGLSLEAGHSYESASTTPPIQPADSDELPPYAATAAAPAHAVAVSDIVPPVLSSHRSDMEYEEHLPLDLALEGVKRGFLFRGHLRVNKYHPQLDASLDLDGRLIDATSGSLVESSGGTSAASSLSQSGQRLGEIFISGLNDRNRAISGDEVIVHMLPQTLWRAPTQRKKIAVKSPASSTAAAEGEEEEDSASSSVTSSSASAEPSVRPVPTGRVVSIIQRNLRPFVATIQLEDVQRSNQGFDYSLVVPMDETIPKIRIRTHQSHLLSNQRLLVQIDEWMTDSKYPTGVYLRSLGRIDSLETGVRCILHELQIHHPPFSINQLRCLPERQIDEVAAKDRKYKVGSGYHARGQPNPFSWTVPPDALVGRMDLRQSHRGCVCSIDPIGCEDIDDALSVLDLGQGRVQIGVHIADVSYFVPAGSLLDQEASQRGTSVYLTDRRLDMLPATLSSDLCSLRGGCDRLALSCLWEMDSEGKVLKTWYGRTVIHNDYALSYEEAQYIYDTQGGTAELPKLPPTHPNYRLSIRERYDEAPNSSLTAVERKALYPKIATLLQLGRRMRQVRLLRGALELNSLEVHFKLDPDTKSILGIQHEPDLEVHQTIAEWMVFANACVAYAIYQRFPEATLLRHHPPPQPQRFEKLIELARNLQLEMDIRSNKSLADSFERAEKILAEREFPSPPSNAQGGTFLDAQQQRSWMLKLLKELAVTAMSEAQYFSSGSCLNRPGDFFHYGLSTDYYTHFTSPIRRYADLIVHRQLLAVIELERKEFHQQKAERKAAERGLPSSGASTSSAISSLFPASTVTAPLLGNEQLQRLSRHLNAKNRQAKFAGSESQQLFLAYFLSGQQTRRWGEEDDSEIGADGFDVPRSIAAAPSPPPRVERCEALIVSLRSNGFIVLLPAYNVKGAVPLVDRDGRAMLSHPLALAFPEDSVDASAERKYGAPARIQFDEVNQTISVSLSAAPSPPSNAPADLLPNLPLSRSFRVFEPVLIDVSLRPNQSRYRTPKPIFTLVWQVEQQRAASSKQSAKKAPTIVEHPPHPDVGHAALATGPSAPAGAKISRPSQIVPIASSALYKILREAATTTKHAKPIHIKQSEGEESDEEEQFIRTKHAAPRQPHVSSRMSVFIDYQSFPLFFL